MSAFSPFALVRVYLQRKQERSYPPPTFSRLSISLLFFALSLSISLLPFHSLETLSLFTPSTPLSSSYLSPFCCFPFKIVNLVKGFLDLMAKSKGIVLDSTPDHGDVFFQDSKARHILQTLMRDYMELQKEVDAMKRKLGAANKRKLVVSAEVRFLRRRYKQLSKVSTASLSPPEKMRDSGCNEVFRGYTVKKQVNPHHKEMLQSRKKRKAGKRDEVVEFAANITGMDSIINRVEVFEAKSENVLENRAVLFDLNEISVGDEDVLQNNAEAVKKMEASRSIMSSSGDNLKLLLYRNVGEGSSSRATKRKISWQDPVVCSS